MKTILQSLRILLVFTLLTGVIYPLAVLGFAQVFCSRQAGGSLIVVGDKIMGSELLAQKFAGANYFWPRPSAADYATVASGASNLGPTSRDLAQAIEERRAKFGAAAPVDLLTASASGLDPDISPEAASLQAPRVAAARGFTPDQLHELVRKLTKAPQFGVLGEPRVNVLALNLALDAVK